MTLYCTDVQHNNSMFVYTTMAGGQLHHRNPPLSFALYDENLRSPSQQLFQYLT